MFKWEKIYLELKYKILNDEYSGYLPSENQLAIKYGISRETVRKIYDKLTSEDLITSVKAKGRIKKQKVINGKLQSFHEKFPTNYVSKYEIINLSQETAEIDVKRYDSEGNLVIYAQSTVFLESLSNCPLSELSLHKNGILSLLTKYSKHKLLGADKKIFFESKEEKVCEILSSPFYILNDSVIFDVLGNVVEHSKNYYNPKHFEMSFQEKI